MLDQQFIFVTFLALISRALMVFVFFFCKLIVGVVLSYCVYEKFPGIQLAQRRREMEEAMRG